MTDSQFDNLKIPSLKFTRLNQRYYKVYKDKHDFVQVEEANSVNEAIDKAGIEHPYAVKLVVYYLGSVVKEEFLVPASPEESAGKVANNHGEETADEAAKSSAEAQVAGEKENQAEGGTEKAEDKTDTSSTPEDKPGQ